jgi:hypothetical protein
MRSSDASSKGHGPLAVLHSRILSLEPRIGFAGAPIVFLQ